MTKHYFTITRQLIAVALLALALAVQAQNKTQKAGLNSHPEPKPEKRLEMAENLCEPAYRIKDTLQENQAPIIHLTQSSKLDQRHRNADNSGWLPIEVCAEVQNFSKVKWTTSGDGYFDDPSNPCTFYNLGENDIEQCNIILALEAIGNDINRDVTEAYQILEVPRQIINITQADLWIGISSFVDLSGISVSEVMAPVADHLIILEDQSGKYYLPSGVNHIGNWDAIGYKAKFSAPCSLPLYGPKLGNCSIDILSQNTYLPVLSTEPLLMSSLLADHLDRVLFIFDWETGYIWDASDPNPDPEFLHILPGKAYLFVSHDPGFTIYFPQEVTPPNHDVSAMPGSVSFNAVAAWQAASDQPWCIVPNSGASSQPIIATYTENPSFTPRSASITVNIEGVAPIVVSILQAGAIPVYDFIELNTGWNLISLDVIPETATPEAVFAPLITTGNLEMVTGFQNQMGVFFDPNGLPFLNTLTQLNPGEGYWVKISGSKDKHPEGLSDVRYPMSDIRFENPISNLQPETTPPFGENQITHQTSHIGHLRSKEDLSRDPITLTVAGTSIPSGFTINLQSGWNLIAYWPQETTAPETAFEQLISANILEMVTGYEQGGKFYDPNGLPFLNTLTEIKNGFGYWVKVNADYNGFSYPITWECGDLLVDPRDGQSYATVQIGDQCWMKENLKTTQFRNGTPIEYPGTNNTAWQNNTTGAYAWYDNDISWKDSYGALYNWHAVKNSAGLCPNGWHVPTDEEWMQLNIYLVAQGYPNDPDDQNSAGNALKSCRRVNSPLGGDCNTTIHPRWEEDDYFRINHYGFDAFNFSGLPGGTRNSNGDFNSLGYNSGWWSYTEHSTTQAWSWVIGYDHSMMYRGFPTHTSGRSVRCLRDETAPPPTYNLNLEISPADAGIVTGASQYQAGEQVNITAEANPGWEFVNWTDDDGVVSEAANFVYTMPAEDVTLTANFVEEQVGFNCGDPLIDSRDGQTYETVLIGNQCWMAENLNIGTRINGSSNQTNNGIIEKYCYNNSDAQCDTYGGLYQWNEMMGYTTTPGVKGICPEGWHLPTDAEWTALTTYVSSQPEYLCNSNTSWIAKSLAATTNWFTHTNTCAIGNNLSDNNATGFTALPGGGRSSNGSFNYIGYYGNWWSATEYVANNAWTRNLLYNNSSVVRDYYNKEVGFSVRCLRD